MSADAVGEIEKDERVLVIKRIHVRYRLEVDADADSEAIDRAMKTHPRSCPVYRSVHPQIDITTSLALVKR